MNKAFKYRIYPNASQKEILSKTFGCVRVIWNACVESFNSYDKATNPNPAIPSKKDLIVDKPWLSEVSAAAIQQKQRDFMEFSKQFFSKGRKKKLGRPVFKGKHGDQSFRLPNQKFRLNGNKIRIEKVGWIRLSVDRVIPDKAKLVSCTVSKNKAGQYFVSILVDTEICYKEKTGEIIGVDFGVKTMAVLSNGIEIQNPHFLRKNQAKLRVLQRHLSKKKKGSNKREKCRRKIAILHQRILNRKLWYIHNITTRLIRDYDVICIEDLNVSGMMKNHCLAGAVSDISFAEIRRQLEYKCRWYGKTLSVIDRFYPSSKTCSRCGWKNDDLKLSDRVFKCKDCGLEIDRDLNAAINIKAAGVKTAKRTQSEQVTVCDEAFKIS